MHLYYLFPSLEEGGLATYRTAIVQNQHLAMLAKVNTPLPVARQSSGGSTEGSGGPLEVFLKHSPVPVITAPPLPLSPTPLALVVQYRQLSLAGMFAKNTTVITPRCGESN